MLLYLWLKGTINSYAVIAQNFCPTTPLTATTHEIDSSEDEKDREEEEAHINGKDQNTPGKETTDRAPTIQQSKKGEGPLELRFLTNIVRQQGKYFVFILFIDYSCLIIYLLITRHVDEFRPFNKCCKTTRQVFCFHFIY